MKTESRYRIIGGLILILLGAYLLVSRYIPGSILWSDFFGGWPVVIISIGIGLLLLGLLSNSPGMAVPASIVAGIGGILQYQNNTGDWESWSYMWALIPGFVGLGVLISGLLEGKLRQEISSGLWLVFISAVLFITFGAVLGGVVIFSDFWPIVLILLGVWIIARSILRRK